MNPSTAPVVVAGYFPPPFHGQAVATERLASLLEPARAVARVSLQNARGLRMDGRPRLADALAYVRERAAWGRALAARPGSTVLWASVSPQPRGHLRDALLVLPLFPSTQRVLGVVHWGAFEALFARPWLRPSTRRLVDRLDGFVFLDDALAAPCAPFIPPEKRLVVPNTVGDDVIATADELAAKRADRRARSTLRLLFLSNMIASKGYGDALGAVARLHARGVAVEATFAGAWPDAAARAAFEAAVRDDGLGAVVQHVGPVRERAAIRRLYLDADALLLPTYYPTEAQPLVLLEALACGTPLLTTRAGAITGVFTDGVEGFFVPPRDPGTLAAAAERLTDADRWTRASEAARARFDARFSPDAVRRAWLAVLDAPRVR